MQAPRKPAIEEKWIAEREAGAGFDFGYRNFTKSRSNRRMSNQRVDQVLIRKTIARSEPIENAVRRNVKRCNLRAAVGVGLAKAMEEVAEWFLGKRHRRQTNSLRIARTSPNVGRGSGPIRLQDR